MAKPKIKPKPKPKPKAKPKPKPPPKPQTVNQPDYIRGSRVVGQKYTAWDSYGQGKPDFGKDKGPGDPYHEVTKTNQKPMPTRPTPPKPKPVKPKPVGRLPVDKGPKWASSVKKPAKPVYRKPVKRASLWESATKTAIQRRLQGVK